MRWLFSVFTLLAVVGLVYSVPGDTISTIPTGNYSVRGLAFDPDDKGIWLTANLAPNNVVFAKYVNDFSGQMQGWMTLQGAYWCFDSGYYNLYSNMKCLAVIDQNSPRIRLYKTSTGEKVYEYAQDPFSGGYDEGLACNYNGVNMYATNYNFNTIMMWDGTSWKTWTSLGNTPPMGVAYGWKHVFVVFSSPTYKISVYKDNGASGEFVTSYTLRNWNSYMVGLSRGRDNIVGPNESLYVACFYPSNAIKEVEIGQFNQTGIETTSVGDIKALFH
ncbi:MAG: hypothetical protein ACUVWP_01040 [bacterium]